MTDINDEIKKIGSAVYGKEVREAIVNAFELLQANKSEVDTALAGKADKATTIAGYGITDAYTKVAIDKLLNNKLNKMPFDDVPTLNSPSYLTSGAVYTALLGKADKATTLGGYGITDAYTKAEVDDKFTAAEKSANKLGKTSVVTDAGVQYPSMAYMYEHYYDFSETVGLLNEKYDASNVEYGIGTLTPGSATTEKVSSANFVYQRIGNVVLINFNIVLNNTSASRLIFSNLPFVCSDFSDVYEYNLSSTGRIFEAKMPKAKSTLIITPKEIEEFIPGETLAFTIKYFIA